MSTFHIKQKGSFLAGLEGCGTTSSKIREKQRAKQWFGVFLGRQWYLVEYVSDANQASYL